jgi:hypothetical protein
METLPKDVRMELAMNLSPPDLINFCATEKKQSLEICGSKDFWRRKLEKDYPEEFLDFYEYGTPIPNPKDTYIRRFTETSKRIEEFIPEFLQKFFGVLFVKYLGKDYRKDLYDTIFSIYQELSNLNGITIDEDIRLNRIVDEIGPILPFNTREYDPDPYELIDRFIEDLIFTDLANRTKLNFVKQMKAGKM